jgi:UMP-CMP kinase
MHHISVGEVLRIESESQNSPYAELIKRHMAKDEISGPIAVPAGLTMKLLSRDMKAAGKKRFIIDGFPRTVSQLLAFNQNVRITYFLYIYAYVAVDLR